MQNGDNYLREGHLKYSQSVTGCHHAFQHMHCLICTLPTQHPPCSSQCNTSAPIVCRAGLTILLVVPWEGAPDQLQIF